MASAPKLAMDTDMVRRQAAVRTEGTFSIGPSDPIWEMVEAVAPTEKLPARHRILLIAAAGAIPWLVLVGLAATQA